MKFKIIVLGACFFQFFQSGNLFAQQDTNQVYQFIQSAEQKLSVKPRDIDGAKLQLDNAIVLAKQLNFNRGLKAAYEKYIRACKLDKDLQCAYKYLKLSKSVNAKDNGPASAGKEDPAVSTTEGPITSTPSSGNEIVVSKRDSISITDIVKNKELMDNLEMDELEALLHSKDSALIMKDTMLYLQMLKLREKQLQADALEKEKLIKDNELKSAAKERWLYIGIIGLTLLGVGFVGYLLSKTRKQAKNLAAEKQRSESLLLNILPAEIATELKTTGKAEAKYHENVTVMFFDFCNFTTISSATEASMLVHELDAYFTAFDKLLDKYHIEKIKTMGDAYMCAAGLWNNENHAEKIIDFALEILSFMESRKQEKMGQNQIYFELRCGAHSGGVTAGVVGEKKFLFDIWGSTVNLAARMEQNSEPGRINITQSTYEQVKDKFECEYRGKFEAKNVGLTDMYFVIKRKA